MTGLIAIHNQSIEMKKLSICVNLLCIIGSYILVTFHRKPLVRCLVGSQTNIANFTCPIKGAELWNQLSLIFASYHWKPHIYFM